ncbi:hypothetical protein MRB53_038814 [Persea americana]|nr:hypothetical protein MRB53_038814 [Persea americana]
MVRSSQSTVTDTARAGLELATAILRERRDIEIKETDVAAMLRAIKSDLDEPDRQGQIFKFLRAVLDVRLSSRKLDRELVQSILLGLFVALVQRVVGETDNTCRQVATLLLSKVLESAADNELKQMKTLASKWLKDESKDGIRNAAVVSWISLVSLDRVNAKEMSVLLVSSHGIVETDNPSSSKLRTATLDLLLKLAEMYPEQTFGSKSTELISSIEQLLVQPDSPVQLRGGKLLEILYNDVASTMSKTNKGLAASSLHSAGGMELSTEDLCDACTVHLRALRLVQADDVELCATLTKNVVFFGRVFAVNQQKWKSSSDTADEVGNDEDTIADGMDDGDEAEDTQNTAFGYLISRLASYFAEKMLRCLDESQHYELPWH